MWDNSLPSSSPSQFQGTRSSKSAIKKPKPKLLVFCFSTEVKLISVLTTVPVRTPRQDKESARVLIGFIGQSLGAELPCTIGGKARVCNLREGGRHLYTLANTEAAGPFSIWLESGSRVWLAFCPMSVFLDWRESWHLHVHQSAWQRAADWWMSVPGTSLGLFSGGSKRDLSVPSHHCTCSPWLLEAKIPASTSLKPSFLSIGHF